VSDKWDASKAFSVVRDIVATDPALVSAVVSGITAGFEENIKKLREDVSLTNLAFDMALVLADKRVTPTGRRMAEIVLARRILAWGDWASKGEREFLERISSCDPNAPPSETTTTDL